jgi:hypothetical protein
MGPSESRRPLSFGFSNPVRPFPEVQRKPLSWDVNRVGEAGPDGRGIGMAVPLGEPFEESNVQDARTRRRRNSVVSDVSSEESDIYGGEEGETGQATVSPMTVRSRPRT